MHIQILNIIHTSYTRKTALLCVYHIFSIMYQLYEILYLKHTVFPLHINLLHHIYKKLFPAIFLTMIVNKRGSWASKEAQQLEPASLSGCAPWAGTGPPRCPALPGSPGTAALSDLRQVTIKVNRIKVCA